MSHIFKDSQGNLEIIESTEFVNQLSKNIQNLIVNQIDLLKKELSDSKSDQLFSTKEAAKFIGYSVSTLKRYRDEGRIKCIKVSENSDRYRKSDLNKFLIENTLNKSA